MGKQVLITGGAGFIGTHLTRELIKRGYRVRIFDNFSPQVHGSAQKLSEMLQELDPHTEVLVGDVRSRQDLLSAMFGVDILFHFAASVGVGQSMYEIKSYIDNNTLGTANLLQILTEHPIEKLIVASSMSIYGEGLYESEDGQCHTQVGRVFDDLQKREWEPHTPNRGILKPRPTPETKQPELSSIYALSKFDQERMSLLIGQAYKIPTVALRFFNVYGPGQSLSNPYTGVLAIFASRLLNNQAPLIFEDGYQMRDFVHVSDVVHACLLALEKKQADGQTLNIGSGNYFSIREVAERMAKALNKSHILPEVTQQYRYGDIRHCFADISLARRTLGYEPRITFEDGLKDLTQWLVHQQAIDRTQQAQQELSARGLAI